MNLQCVLYRMLTIEFIEVKRQSKNFDEELLKSKAATFMKAVGPYEGYEISYKGISIDDM